MDTCRVRSEARMHLHPDMQTVPRIQAVAVCLSALFAHWNVYYMEF